MKNHSKRKRHYSHQCGRQFVNNFNGLRYYPTYDTEISINGENSNVDVTTHLRTFPMSELVDVTSLEKLKGKMEISSEVPLNTTPSLVPPANPETDHKKKPLGFSILKWLGVVAGTVLSVSAGVRLFKKTA